MTSNPRNHAQREAWHAAPPNDSRALQRVPQEQAQVDAVLAKAAHELARCFDTADSLALLCRLTVEALRCDYSCILLWQPHAAAYVPSAQHGIRDEHWRALSDLRLSRAVMRDFIDRLERETVMQTRTALVGAAPGVPLNLKYGASASLHTVLRRGSVPVGVLVGGYRHRPESFTPRDEQLARGLALLGAMALETVACLHDRRHASANEADLVTTIAHELRTPLNVIVGYNDLLLEEAYGPLTARQRGTLQQVEESVQELLDLAGTLLDLSRVECGRRALELQETDVGKVLQEIQGQVEPLRKQVGLTFDSHIPAPLAALRTDRTQLKLLLRNLIVNALKFTDHGGVTVTVRSRDEGIEVAVADTGIGMAPETVRRIFEPFVQADPTHIRNRGGVGLGLFIVRRIIEALNGTIRVDSTAGCGSTFRVWLPHARPPAAETRLAAGRSSQPWGRSACAAAS